MLHSKMPRLFAFALVFASVLLFCSLPDNIAYCQYNPLCDCYEPGQSQPGGPVIPQGPCVACADFCIMPGVPETSFCDYNFHTYVPQSIMLNPYYPDPSNPQYAHITEGQCVLLDWDCPVPCLPDYFVRYVQMYYPCTIPCP